MAHFYTMNLDAVVKEVMTRDRARAMDALKISKICGGVLYALDLKSKKNAERNGAAHIILRRAQKGFILDDRVELGPENRGFESDLCALKCCMFYDLGATSVTGGVSNLRYSPATSGHAVSFNVGKAEAPKALWHYMETTFDVMGNFFKGYEMLDLALSMARERGQRQFGG